MEIHDVETSMEQIALSTLTEVYWW